MRSGMLALASAALAMAGLGQAANAQQPAPKAISAEELKSLIDKKVKFFFLDVREPDEVRRLGTMKGYVNIPLGQLEARIAEIPKRALVVTA